MQNQRRVKFACLGLFTLALTQVAWSAAYEISSAEFPAAGGVASGGNVEVSFSIHGLPSIQSFGGIYEFTAGSWVESPPGDCDFDGMLTSSDINRFVGCLAGPGSAPPGPECACFNVDSGVAIDLRDLSRILER